MEAARDRGLIFEVAAKESARGRWLTVHPDIQDLDVAMKLAEDVDAVEVGVFLVTRFGGFLYWTSKWPDRFNLELRTFAPR